MQRAIFPLHWAGILDQSRRTSLAIPSFLPLLSPFLAKESVPQDLLTSVFDGHRPVKCQQYRGECITLWQISELKISLLAIFTG